MEKYAAHMFLGGVNRSDSTCCRMFEGEARFRFGQLMEVVEADHIGCLKMALWVLVPFPTPPHFIVEL